MGATNYQIPDWHVEKTVCEFLQDIEEGIKKSRRWCLFLCFKYTLLRWKSKKWKYLHGSRASLSSLYLLHLKKNFLEIKKVTVKDNNNQVHLLVTCTYTLRTVKKREFYPPTVTVFRERLQPLPKLLSLYWNHNIDVEYI